MLLNLVILYMSAVSEKYPHILQFKTDCYASESCEF